MVGMPVKHFEKKQLFRLSDLKIICFKDVPTCFLYFLNILEYLNQEVRVPRGSKMRNLEMWGFGPSLNKTET